MNEGAKPERVSAVPAAPPAWGCELLRDWFSEARGRALPEAELRLLELLLPALPGQQIVQLGMPAEARRVLVEGGHLVLIFFNARGPQGLGCRVPARRCPPGAVGLLLCRKRGIPLIPLRNRWSVRAPQPPGGGKPLGAGPGVAHAPLPASGA